MTIQWTGFPAAQAAVAADVIVGLLGGTANQRFLGDSWLLTANNLSDLPSVPTALTNLGLGSTSTPTFGVTTAATSTSSATPGTIRALIGSVTGTNTTQTSGNLVGVRGVANIVGTSTSAYIYGVQGKVIATGTLASGQFQAGVYGQADFSAATINGGQFAPLWGDYGTSISSVTGNTGLYGVAMTNTTGKVIYALDYRYGDATYWQSLQSASTYFKAAGTSSGSAGYASGCNATKVLEVNINGTNYYIPAFAQNT